MTAIRRAAVVAASTAAFVSTGLVVTAPLARAVDTSSAVVISEVYGGGGNSGATLKQDFIELYNKGTTPVDVSGWSVQYGSATGTTYAATPLTGSIAAGAYYLIGEAKGSGGTVDLPPADVTGTLALSGTAGKVALSTSATALTCAATCSTTAGVVDLVGYGSTANDSAGMHPAPAQTSTTADQRSATGTNTGDNAADFVAAAPTPKAAPGGTTPPPDPCTASPLPPECTPGTTTIQDIQGSGFLSPLKGQTVERVPGIVTAVRSTGTGRGFWIQQPTRDDARPAASSGVFVFSSTAPTVTVGDSVLITGTVSDFYPGGAPSPTQANLSTTELSPTTTTTVSHGAPLPAPLVLTPDTVPTLYAPTVPADSDGNHNIESITTVDPSHSALEFWEAHEGMLVSVADARVVGPGKATFGEIYVTTKPAELATPRGGAYLPSYAGTPSGRLLVSPVNGVVPPANVGDVLTGTTSGPVDWSSFGGYDIAATAIGARQDNGLTPTSATVQATDQLAIATYNVQNLAPSDAQSKYDALAAGVVNNLKMPDVIAVEEIQDNSGATDDGVVASDQTVAKLTAAITAAGGPAYSSASIDPVNDADGGQPGGNIRSVFLYNPDRVTFVAKPGGDSTTPVTVTVGADGTPELSASPGRVDPGNTAWTSSRKPLAGEFVFGGKKVIVVANHFNSKGGDQTADGRFQPPTRSSEVQRTQQATVLNGFVKQVLAADPRANVVLAGDFNDYQFSGPVTTLTDNGATLTDLITTLPANERYTYVFNGISQVLDHIFTSKALTDVSYDVVHLNSEFANQTSDHDPQVVRIRPGPTPAVNVRKTYQHAGRDVGLGLSGWAPRTMLTITLDGTTPLATYTTKKLGRGSLTVTLPSTTSKGVHQIVVTAPDGTTASGAVTVTRACPSVTADDRALEALAGAC
ncbi:lamin tail domain-containing protein [Lapillicoccus sp.]|uniref:lamin tail domain-containing protein n=1 Tax=Lapillicoccus sp. TaxID=1909287 RepID=UPI0025F5D2EA|nr:lamin tail domain-containing protein [Lapillicoccus sp.]